jgi:microsomal dipeptidase-like Zn-dependent dipeptidase
MLDLGGAKVVGLGGDWDGCDPIEPLSNIVQLTDLYEYLLIHNYPEDLLEDLFYNNLMRVVRER